MRSKKATCHGCWAFAVSAGIIFFFISGSARMSASTSQRMLEMLVSADNAWTDTGVDVAEGQEVYFRADGQISLQRGNPVTYCGPEGYNYRSLQQPLQDQNIGALIGKVYFLISVEVDEETGEEIRNEREEIFYVGPSNRIIMPMTGRLFLGINENLVADNGGVFTALIYAGTQKL